MPATAEFRSDPKGVWHYNHVTFTPIAKNFMLCCRLIYMLSMLYVRLTIKVKVGILESIKVGWYPHKITGSSHLKPIFPCNIIKIDWHASPFSKLRNHKFAKLVLRMVFKSLETFLNRFNFPALMRCKAKFLEILLQPSHTHFWLSKTMLAALKSYLTA